MAKDFEVTIMVSMAEEMAPADVAQLVGETLSGLEDKVDMVDVQTVEAM